MGGYLENTGISDIMISAFSGEDSERTVHIMKMKKLISLLAAAMMLITLLAGAAFAEDAAVDLTGHIVILHTNDSHGRVDANLGFTRVAVAKERLEEAGAVVLLLDAGDTLHGLPFATVSRGESIVKIMNEVGYDAMVPGNHDFNYGADRLKELAGMAEFPVLAANVVNADETTLLEGAAIIEKGHVKFGVFGLSTPETVYKTNPLNVGGLTFADPIEAARKQVAALEAEDCTIIIALAHIGLDESSGVTSREIAEQVEGIDVIVDGHSHTVLEDGLWVNNTLIVSTGEYIEAIGCIDIDSEGAAAATLLTGDDFGEADVDAEVDAVIAEITTAQDELLNVVVGQTSVELQGAREIVRTSESNLGNLAADAFRNATGADIALTNGGGIRDSIPAGDITKKQLVTVFPFGNYVVTMDVTGEQLTAMLENGVSRYPDADGRFPQVSGLSFRFDPEQPAGSRVFDVKVGGEAVDPAKTYVLATNDYIAIGGDEYPVGDNAVTGEFSAMEEILIAYIDSFEAPVAPEIEGRIIMEAKPAE